MKSTTSVVSQAASIAMSTASQVEVKMKHNQTKAQLRVLLKNIDQEKSGVVKEDAFFTILKLHGVELPASEQNRLKKSFSRAGKINFSDALHSLNIDLESAVLNEEKWTVQKEGDAAKALEAQNSLFQAKAVSHLSRMSLAEFNERTDEMNREIDGDAAANYGNIAPVTRNQQPNAVDSVSKAGSTVSKPVQEKNLESLHEFRSQLGLIKKNRPDEDSLAGVSVQTPARASEAAEQQLDRLSVSLSTVGVKDNAANAQKMQQFVKNMAKTDRAQYDKLVELMRYFNAIDADMRLVSQLKACFISKEQGNLNQVPSETFKESIRGIFKHFRQVDEIVEKVSNCVDVEVGEKKMAESVKLSTLVEFMKCFPMMQGRNKNTSSGMDYVKSGEKSTTAKSVTVREASPVKQQSSLTQLELDYVKQLTTLVLTRMEDKHRNITDIFRFMDERGKGKVRKSDFTQAVERMRISIAREDVQKVWNYIDAKQQGWIGLPDLSNAYNNKMFNFNKSVEVAIESKAVKGYKEQQKSQFDQEQAVASNGGQQVKIQSTRTTVGTQPIVMGIPQGGRSPMTRKSIEHIFGAQQLPSDNIKQVVGNDYMQEATVMHQARNEKIAQRRALIPKGLKSKQTVTSLLRREANRQQITADHTASPTNTSLLGSKQARNMSLHATSKADSTNQLPPLRNAPRQMSRGLLSHKSHAESNQNLSRAGSYATGRAGSKNPQADRVLFPTHVKESFLQRNKHMANQKMEAMASDFAKRAIASLK